jgi:hypothetical protein
VKNRVLSLWAKIFVLRNHFEDLQRASGPAMGPRNLLQLFSRLRQGDIDNTFALLDAGQQELQGEGSFARAGVAFHKIQVPLREPSAKNVIQTPDARRDADRTRGEMSLRVMRIAVSDATVVSAHSVPTNAHELSG